MDNCKFCCTIVKGLSVKKQNNIILDDVNMHLHCGELTVIIGKNGAGKTTLLKALNGEIKYTGSVEFTSKHNNSKALTVGYVPQKLNVEEMPMSVYDLVNSYCFNYPTFVKKSKKNYTQIQEHLKEMEADKLIDKKVCNLSGGELQKVLIAIATIPYPELLLLDEPVSGVDVKGKDIVYKLLDKIKRNHDISILMVSHDFQEIDKYADNVILLDKKVALCGSPTEVFNSNEFKNEFYIGGKHGEDI